jgi:hypothetical protein
MGKTTKWRLAETLIYLFTVGGLAFLVSWASDQADVGLSWEACGIIGLCILTGHRLLRAYDEYRDDAERRWVKHYRDKREKLTDG